MKSPSSPGPFSRTAGRRGERRRAGLASVAVLVLVTACDPIYTMEVRQALRPSPAPGCVTRVVHESPLVSEARPADIWNTPEGFYVALRDSAGAGAHWNSTVARRVAPDSTGVLSVSFQWLGYVRPDAEEAVKMEAAANRMLAELRAACAPSAPPEAECVRTGPFYEKPCSVAR